MIIIIEKVRPIVEAMFNLFEDNKDSIDFLNELGLYIKSDIFDPKKFGNMLISQLEDKCIKDKICMYCGCNDLYQKKIGHEDIEAYGIKDKVALYINVCSDCGLTQSEDE